MAGPVLSIQRTFIHGHGIRQPSSSDEQLGSKVWTECGDDEIPAGIQCSAVCLPTLDLISAE